MLLAVDLGNTQTSFGVFSKDALLHHWRFETKVPRSADEYGSLLFPLLQRAGISEKELKKVVLCSVVPDADRAFEDFCRTYWDLKVDKITYDMALGFGLEVDSPSTVGADRLANTAFAVKHLRLPAVIVDCGTATTLDVISPKPAFIGGVILLGLKMSVDALSLKTAQLPLVDLEFPPSVIGKNTIHCIQSGILFGYCELLDGLLKRVENELGEKTDIVLTGGLSSLLREQLRTPHRYFPDLTLDGIRILSENIS